MGQVTIFLIRHGESVDNVAGLLAGVRDSPLTSHGATQARRLGAHLASTRLDWIFASNLQRAASTAEAVRTAQRPEAQPSLVQVPDLREKDFGSDEGRRWGKEGPSAADGETGKSMRERSSRFIDEHLAPIVLSSADGKSTANIAVVSHGMILATLLAVLRGPECFQPSRVSSLVSDTTPRWSNTGFARLDILSDKTLSASQPSPHPRWPNCRLVVASVNNVAHLAGLRKTRGGIGSAQHDARQRTLTSFFVSGESKKRKAEEQLEK